MLKTRMLLVGIAASAFTTMSLAQLDGPAPLAWRWVQSTSVPPTGSPLVDGDVVFVAVGQRVYALDKDTGNQRWQFPQIEPIAGFFRTEPIKVGGLIIAAADNKAIYALDEATGEKKWQFNSLVPILGAPVAVGDHLIGIALADNSILAINASDGAPAWPAPLKLLDSLIGRIGSNATFIFALTTANDLLAIDAVAGKITWHKNFTSIGSDAQPVVYGDTVYVNSTSFVVALGTAAGTLRWSKDAGDEITYPPAISPDGVAVVTREGKVVFFDPINGRRLTHEEMGPDRRPVTVDSVDLGSFAYGSGTSVGHEFIFPTTAGTLTMFDPHTGRLLWNYTIKPLVKGQPPTTPPSGGPSGGGRVGGAGGFGQGASKVEVPPPTSIEAAGPPVAAGNTLLVLARDGSVLAFDRTNGVDLTPPTVAMTFPRPGDQVSSLELEVHFQIDDEASGLKVDSVAVSVDGRNLDYKLSRDGELVVRFNLSGKNGTMTDGRHDFSVTASDWMGNTGTTKFSLTIDNNLPKLGPPPKNPNQGGGGGGGSNGGSGSG